MKKIISLLLALVLTLSACSVALAADVVLRPGDKGDAVKEVQTLLTSYGYYSGKINGSYNTATTTAVRNFQRYNSLTVDGKVGPKTMAVLKSGNAVSAPLKPNETNNSASVKMVQTLLRDLGYYNGKIDGKYGKATIAAVKMFQKYNELPIDGKVGEDTLNRMKSSAAIKAPVNQKDSYSTENKHIQERLKYYGYYTGKIDGIYGSGTIAAVKAFQRANGLPETGVADEATQRALFSESAVKSDRPKCMYMLKISVDDQRVYAYKWVNGSYSQLVRTMKCSTGKNATPTPKGTFQNGTGPGARWHYFKKFKCWAQYAYYIEGDIMFHSVLYKEKDGPVTQSSVNNLGRKASHGCIRLSVEDAKWINQNCPRNTKIIVY